MLCRNICVGQRSNEENQSVGTVSKVPDIWLKVIKNHSYGDSRRKAHLCRLKLCNLGQKTITK